LFQGQTLQGRKLNEETTLVSCYLVVEKEENENMWEMLGLFRGFKQGGTGERTTFLYDLSHVQWE